MTDAPQSGFSLTENGWRALLLSTSVIILVFTVYCLSQGITIIFMHLYYFPIILFAYHYHKKGVILSAVLGLLYVALVVFFASQDVAVIAGALVRFIVFIGIAFVVSFLSETLEQRELERNTIIANSEDGIFVVDLSTQLISEANLRGADMLGFTPGDLVNVTLETIWKDTEERVRFLDLIKTGGQARTIEAYLTQKTGGTRTVLISAGALPEYRVVITVTDITDREYMLTEMRRLSEVRESIISNANVWLMVLDSRGRILEWNLAAEQISGYPAAEVIGGNEVWKHLYPEKSYRKVITGKITEIIKKDTYLENLQTAIVCRDGTQKTILWNTRGLPDIKGVTGHYIAIGVDITDREKVGQVSKEYAEWYSTLLRTTLDGYNLVDGTGRLIEVNDNYCRMTGFSRGELLGRSISDLDADESGVVAFSHMQKILATGSDRFESRHRIKGGGAIDVEVSVTLEAQKQQFIVFVRDITGRKRAEKAISDSEEKFHTIADFTTDWEYWQGQDKGIIYMSPSCERFTGYTQQEFLADSQLLEAIVHPDDLASVQDHNHEAWETRQALSTDFRIIHRDGTVRWIGHACRQVYDDKGKALGRRVSNRDITDQKIASLALGESEEKFRVFFTTSRDCVFITTVEGSWVDLNDAAVELFGYDSKEELLQVNIRDLYADPEERVRHIRKINEKGYTRDFPLNLKKKDGAVIQTLITSVTRKDQTGTVTGYQGTIRDVTRQKLTEEALRNSQIKLAESMDLAHLVNWEFDVPTGIFTFNDRFYAMYGTTAEREGGYLMPAEAYAREFVHPDDAHVVADEVKKAIVTDDPDYTTQVEHRIIRKDGEVRYVIVRFGITKDAEGRTVKTRGANQDITERKRAEEETKRSIERFRTVMDSIDAFVYVADMKTYELLFLNKYGRDIWGEIEGKVCWQTIQSGQKGPCPFCTNDRLVDDNGNPTGIYNWEFKNTVNGRWYDCRDSAIRWLDGRLVRLEIATDITGRKQIEEALRESEQKFRDLFENSRDGIIIADAQTKKFVDNNQMFSHMLGYRPEEIKNLGLMDIHPEDGRLHAFNVFEKMARREINVSENLPIRRKDGTIFYADISAYPISKSNKDYLVGVFRDITERRQAEELRRHFTEELEQQVRSRTQELETSLNEKVVLLREVHHRVRNNFQIILSLLSLQSRSIGDERVTRAMRESQNRIQAMAFVHKTLYTSENLARIDLEPYVKYLTTQLFTLYVIRPKTLSLILEVHNIFVDINTAIPLGLVINELVSNSLKHAFPEGRKGRIAISIQDDPEGLTLTYEDNGAGFSPDFDWQTTESLGFRLIRVLIDQLNGTIEKEPSEGTRFIIRVMKKTDAQGRLHGTFNQVPE